MEFAICNFFNLYEATKSSPSPSGKFFVLLLEYVLCKYRLFGIINLVFIFFCSGGLLRRPPSYFNGKERLTLELCG